MERYNQIFAVTMDCIKVFIEHGECDLTSESIKCFEDDFEKAMLTAALSEIDRMREAQEQISGVCFKVEIYREKVGNAYKLFYKKFVKI